MKTIVEINNNNYGSTGSIMLNLADIARQNGYNVYTYSKNSKTAKNFTIFNHNLIGSRIDRIISDYLCYLSSLKNHFNIFNTIFFIQQLKKIKPDLIHIHNFHDSYINLPLFFTYIKKNNIPVVWTLHDGWIFTGQCTCFELAKCYKWETSCKKCPQTKKYPSSLFDLSNLLFNEKRNYFSNLDNLYLVSPSQWLKGLVEMSFLRNKNIKVINNGINLVVFRPCYDESLFSKYHLKNKFIILGVATNWNERKGLDVFIELSKHLDENYQIVMVGTDDNVDSVLPQNIVSIHKTYNQEELAKMYSIADVFFNPTREDNFPTVNIEALACGTPVITFDTGGSPEIIDEDSGYIVKNDIDEIIDRIDLICKKNTISSKNCIKRANHFDMKLKFDEYMHLYNTILDLNN